MAAFACTMTTGVKNNKDIRMYQTETQAVSLTSMRNWALKHYNTIKLTIYGLLLINFSIYIYQDIQNAKATLPAEHSFLDLMSAFTTSIDYFAWLLLIIVFELETYSISDETWNKQWAWGLRAIRVFAYASLGHTLFSYSNALADSYQVPFKMAESLGACDFADQGYWWLGILTYEPITFETCNTMPTTNLWQSSVDGVLTNENGIFWEHIFAHIDLLEITSWLVIMGAIEVNVAFAMKNQTNHPAARTMRIMSHIAYSLIVLFSIAWIWAGQPVYAWDEFVWIAGFAVIEMNISEWKEEISENQLPNSNGPINGGAT